MAKYHIQIGINEERGTRRKKGGTEEKEKGSKRNNIATMRGTGQLYSPYVGERTALVTVDFDALMIQGMAGNSIS